ncbi:MAG TPA: hypothetical protein VJ438_01850 [Candidatus Nanoarchaeia archaeon]|nr:hypothetical protein [Candidatus Nanoarchaeia archaeon]
MKLLLVYPEILSSNTNTSTYSLPLGLGSIATYCKNRMGNELEVRIFDGSLMEHEEELEETKKYKPDVTGINSTIASQGKGYEIGELAKNLGSKVFFGGVNSTNLWKNMLNNRQFIDGVVLYDGEIPTYLILNRLKETKILGDDCFKGIPNLAYRSSNREAQEPGSVYIPSLDDLPEIDYSFFDLDRFFKQTERKGFGKAVTYYAGKGCTKRGAIKLKDFYSLEEYEELVKSMNVCTFCGRNELGLRNLSEDKETRVIKSLHDKYGVRGFFNVQDTVNLKNTSPIGLADSWFRIFIGIESITQENINRLKQRYGSNLVFQAGIEAANPQMRQVFGKTVTDLGDLTGKVKLMRKEGVQLHASFILGGRGETKESMKKTTQTAKRLADYDNVSWILISPQLILPGSPDYRALLQMPKMQKKYSKQDLFTITEINRDFLAQFTPDIERGEIIEEIKTTFEDIKNKNKKVVLDVKGVVNEEEDYINPNRSYEKNES